MKDNNWAKCPRCDEPDIEALKKGLDEMYGVLPNEEWIALYKRAEQAEDLYTLKEYSEIGANDEGILEMRYEAHCNLCGFSHEVTYKKELTGSLEAAVSVHENSRTYNNDINRLKRLSGKLIKMIQELIAASGLDYADSPFSEWQREAELLGVQPPNLM
jgi:hypothetical protein